MMYYGSMGYLGGFWMIVFWAAFIWLIIWLVRQNPRKDSSLEILKRRYAQGEISKKEYEEMKKEVS